MKADLEQTRIFFLGMLIAENAGSKDEQLEWVTTFVDDEGDLRISCDVRSLAVRIWSNDEQVFAAELYRSDVKMTVFEEGEWIPTFLDLAKIWNAARDEVLMGVGPLE